MSTLDQSLGANQGWDMTDILSAPTDTPLFTAASNALATGSANFGATWGGTANPATNANVSPEKSTDNTMLWLAAAGVVIALAGLMKGK